MESCVVRPHVGRNGPTAGSEELISPSSHEQLHLTCRRDVRMAALESTYRFEVFRLISILTGGSRDVPDSLDHIISMILPRSGCMDNAIRCADDENGPQPHPRPSTLLG